MCWNNLSQKIEMRNIIHSIRSLHFIALCIYHHYGTDIRTDSPNFRNNNFQITLLCVHVSVLFHCLTLHITLGYRFHHQALVELKILDVIKRKDKDNLHNVIHMKEYFYFRNHLCISFELLGLVNIFVFCKLASLPVQKRVLHKTIKT